MCSVYDYDPSPQDNQMVSIINNFLEVSIPALMPEKAALLKVFPFCKRLCVNLKHNLICHPFGSATPA